MTSLAGLSVAIAGGTGDIGSAAASELVRRGARVTVIGRQAVDQVPRRRGVTYVTADVRDRVALGAALAVVDPLDVVVSNAAIVRSAPFLEISEADWDEQIRTNLTGGFNAGQLAARVMIARHRPGRIIFVGSWVQDEAWPEIAAYSASKAGLRMLAKTMALELAPLGITVNVVAPGIVKAGMAKRQLENEPQYARRAASAVPLGTLQTAVQVARLIAFLCSDDAAYMTGSVLLADGGASLLHGPPVDFAGAPGLGTVVRWHTPDKSALTSSRTRARSWARGRCGSRIARPLWVDILGRVVSRAALTGQTSVVCRTPSHVGAVALRRSGGFILALADGFWVLGPDESTPRPFAKRELRPGVRFNDGKCDPAGRFLAGTMAYSEEAGAGELLRLELDGTISRLVADITISNGLGWSPDGRTMYFVDSPTRRVEAFQYEPNIEALGARRLFVSVPASAGIPDGLAVDEEGGVWVALWGGGRVHRYRPDGTLDAVIALPITNSTSCAFGGRQLDLLFVTSARTGLDPERLRSEPHAGGLFVSQPGVRGVPIAEFAG